MILSEFRWKYISIGAVSVLSVQAVFCLLFLRYIGDYLVVDDRMAPSDAIVVLGGDSCDFHRTKLAVQLYKQGYASWIVLSGNSSTLEEQLKNALLWGLADSSRIVIINCKSTFEEAQRIAPIVRQHGWNSIIVVTDRFHTRRARSVFKNRLQEIQVRVAEAYNSTYDHEKYWRKEGSLDAVFQETIKMLYYWYQYGIKLW